MGIKYFEEDKIFKLDTPSSSYVIGIVDDVYVGHIYYGKYVSDHQLAYLLRLEEPPFKPSINNREKVSFLGTFPMEYATYGGGDYREACLKVRTASGHHMCELSYDSFKIYKGKKKLENLPATFGDEKACETLEITCLDKTLNLYVTLIYTVFNELDVVTRSVYIENAGEETISLTRVYSACIDMDHEGYDMITLNGAWGRERHIERKALGYGKQSISSICGKSSHQSHPFMALLQREANDEYGDVYGFSFVYSGNFIAQAEVSEFDKVRMVMGINDCDFNWQLKPNDHFTAPEVVMVYSTKGLGAMTRSFHDLFREHLIRSKYKDKKRPILINNWEATYFDFNTEKLLDIAQEASKLGIEMLVMDDGWFGERNDDNSSLGDWQVNEKKLPGGLKHLVDEVNKLGMQFGIWVEPEMISPNSNLYRQHQDWAIQIPGRSGSLSRNQYVLDLSRKEVRDYVFMMLYDLLSSANIAYVKWDMNRPLSDIGSFGLSKDQQGELLHRYVLGVYELQERLITAFPDLLLENCSGGGGRFDPGMLYYSPQIWCSDNTDAIDRLMIQEGTAIVYPLSTMGSHVSVCPNHTVGRITPFETRGYVALSGTFGYELDVTKLSEEEKEMVCAQTKMYHKYNGLIQQGDYYRIASYGKNHEFDCIQIVSKDKKEALIIYIHVLAKPNYPSKRIKLKGLDKDYLYEVEETKQCYHGDVLMHVGIMLPNMFGDFKGKLIHLVKRD